MKKYSFENLYQEIRKDIEEITFMLDKLHKSQQEN